MKAGSTFISMIVAIAWISWKLPIDVVCGEFRNTIHISIDLISKRLTQSE